MRPIRIFAQTLLSAALILAPGNSASQEPAKAPPLSEEQVLALVTSANLKELSVNRVIELITERGVAFSVTDVFLLELNAREADVAIVETLRRLRNQGKDFIPTPSEPAATSSAEKPNVPAKAPTEENWPQFLQAVRSKATAYIDNLPNFICTQITQRFIRFFPSGWRQVDNFVADLSYYDKKEHYKILTVANQASPNATMETLSGTRSTGEFGTTLRALFDPNTNATFRLEGLDQTNGRDTVRIGYQVPKETSSRTINYNNQRTVITAYRGRCWIDPTSYQVVRLEDKALAIPEDFPITRSEGATDYDLAEISGVKYWLPVRAEVLLVEGAAKVHTRNVIEFKKYRKFEAEVKISTE
jgi:hypothetical protein